MRKRKKREPLPVWIGWSLFILIAASLLGWYTTANPTQSDASASTLVVQLVFSSDLSKLSSILVAGSPNTIYRFKVTNNSLKPVALKRLTFAVNVSAGNGEQDKLDRFRFIRDGVDLTTQASITGAQSNADNRLNAARVSLEGEKYMLRAGASWVNVQFADDPGKGENLVASNTTVTYELRAWAGRGFESGNKVTTELLGDTTIPNTGASYIKDNDPDAGEWVVVLADKLGKVDYTDVELIWSNLAALAHNANLSSDNQPQPISSSDWLNGWMIKNFPLSKFTLTS